MGGAAGYGNITPNAEFNIYSDPLACQHVIDICKEANKELVMVGLDLSHVRYSLNSVSTMYSGDIG